MREDERELAVKMLEHGFDRAWGSCGKRGRWDVGPVLYSRCIESLP
jgi:hypothetical protein